MIQDFYRGDTRVFTLTFTRDDSAVDITGATVYFTMKYSPADADSAAVIAKTVTEHAAPAGGVTSVRLEASETAAIEPGAYYYDFQLKDAAGNISTVVAGVVNVKSDITRAG